MGSARQNYRGAQFPFIHALSFRDRSARTFSLADPLVNQGRQSGLRLQLCRGGVGGSKIWCQETEAVLASMHRLAIACQTNPTAGDCVGAKMTRCGFPECPLPQPKASCPQQSAATFRRAQGQSGGRDVRSGPIRQSGLALPHCCLHGGRCRAAGVQQTAVCACARDTVRTETPAARARSVWLAVRPMRFRRSCLAKPSLRMFCF